MCRLLRIREQLKQVINNIVGNSHQVYRQAKGNHQHTDDWMWVDSIRVEIDDNGKGIAAKDLPEVFLTGFTGRMLPGIPPRAAAVSAFLL